MNREMLITAKIHMYICVYIANKTTIFDEQANLTKRFKRQAREIHNRGQRGCRRHSCVECGVAAWLVRQIPAKADQQ